MVTSLLISNLAQAVEPTPAVAPAVSFKDSGIPKELVDNLPKIDSQIPVVFFRFEGKNLPLALDYLTRSLPTAIIARLNYLPNRDLSKEILNAEAEACLDRLRLETGKALSTLVATRDNNYLLNGQDLTKISEVQGPIDQLTAAWKRAQVLQQRDLRQVVTRSFKLPAESAELPSWSGQLSAKGLPTSGAARQYWTKDGSQFLVLGSVEAEANFVAIRIVVVQCLTGEAIVDQVRRYQLADIQLSSQELTEQVAFGLLGYYPGSIQVLAKPETAEILISPALPGKLDSRWPMVPAGSYNLTVRAAGYEAQTMAIEVQNGRDVTIPVSLKEIGQRKIAIDSVPTGARVYEGANYLGVTPYSYPAPLSDRLLLIQLEGFGRQALDVGQKSPDSLTAHLYPKYLDWNAEVALRRDQVYTSLGFFALSLIIPIVFDGLYNVDFATANSIASTSNRTSAQQSFLSGSIDRLQTYYLIRNLGIGISLVLLVDSFASIGSYIDAANQLDFIKAK